MRIGLIGVPFNSAGTDQAEATAPAALHAANLEAALAKRGPVTNYGDVALPPAESSERDAGSGLIEPARLVAMIAAVRSAVATAYTDNVMPLLIGGDSSILLGGLLAARDRLTFNPGLLYLDGHEDAWPPFGSITGEAGDMALGLALGLTRADGVDALAIEFPVLDPHDVGVLGPRDGEELKSEGIESIRHRVIVMDDSELRAAGLTQTAECWMKHFERHPGRFWLHLDLDVLAADANPAISYVQPGGLTWDELRELLAVALAAQHLIGIDIAGYNPDKDHDATVARAIVDLLATA
ncbi:MAG TPA: arginase family protein [Thermomicrobiales bacterium]|nr:arginase family protein [Thermomicrobiales bacterium]